MEPDRFQHNQKYYIVGIICLMLSLGLFCLSVYMIPYAWFGWSYDIPDFAQNLASTLQANYQLTPKASVWIVILIFFLPALILAFIADILSNRIDNEIHGLNTIEKEKPKKKPGDGESANLILRIFLILLLVFVAAEIFQWAISSAPPSVD
jgi:MFS family permease